MTIITVANHVARYADDEVLIPLRDLDKWIRRKYAAINGSNGVGPDIGNWASAGSAGKTPIRRHSPRFDALQTS